MFTLIMKKNIILLKFYQKKTRVLCMLMLDIHKNEAVYINIVNNQSVILMKLI